MNQPRLAIIPDFPEEGWPSMDVCAEMLARHASAEHAGWLRAGTVCPTFRRRALRVPALRSSRWAFSADRLLNRWWDYPGELRSRRAHFTLFHVCDHSYAHLVHRLPAERTGVYCHDLDAFRCLLDGRARLRPSWFKAMMRRVLAGLQKAAVVFVSTTATRDAIVAHGLLDCNRLVHAPYGTSPEYTPKSDLEEHGAETRQVMRSLDGRRYLLHVGSCIARKRIDVLLEVYGGLRDSHPEVLLVQVGGEWTPEQRAQIGSLQSGGSVRQFRGLSRETLAALMRGAALVLQPSEAEGFGLPVVEALACDAPVVASHLPELREAGGSAAVYCRVADVPEWVETVDRLLNSPELAPTSAIRLEQARKYSWASYARTILNEYQRLVA
ncbi:MAG: glycosyltransferase [Planctomycetota bacterium]